MPLIETKGAASAQGFGEFAASSAGAVNYIEDVFSTYLYTGNGSTQTITNGIDLSTKGGLVWLKKRSAVGNHFLVDTIRGGLKPLYSNLTNAQPVTNQSIVTAFNTNGFTLGNEDINDSAATYASWTFRKQPKFFDVVTYTGNGTAGRTVAHSLGSVPGCMIVRPTSAVDDWFVYHRSLLNSQSLFLNLTAAASNTPSAWNSTTPTSTEFTVGTNTATNANGVSYVAYLFAHDAGGFGLTGTDNVISCGSYTGNGSNTNGTNVDLGYEPQWLLIKKSSSGTSDWLMVDNMRGMTADGTDEQLKANSSGAADSTTAVIVKSTGFQLKATGNPNTSGETYIYIAIRRGPMKVPTSGTSVYNAISRTGTGATANVTGVGFPPDMLLDTMRSTGWNRSMWDRLRGANKGLKTNDTGAEVSYTDAVMSYNQDGVTLGADGNFDVNASGYTYINWFFRRAPSFFDEVCYTGTGSNTTYTHNLGVAPELIIFKTRGVSGGWRVICNFTSTSFKQLELQVTDSAADWNYTDGVYITSQPTSTTFKVGSNTNTSATTFVTYLFATCAGVSKVGSYTGTGATQTISCGFTGGARFVLIKRTDSTGDWYVWDTARGMVAGTDPSLSLNSTAAEVNANSIYTTTGGFQIVSTAAGINASGGNYIFLAIA